MNVDQILRRGDKMVVETEAVIRRGEKLVARLESGDVKPEDPQVKEILFQLKERVRINADFNTELQRLAGEHEKITAGH